MNYSITPLLTGVRNPDQGIMTYQRGYGQPIWLPIYALLVRGGGKNILIDTGLDEDEVIEPEAFVAETGLSVKTITECLAEHGLTPDDIDVVINTHLHDDHCGNNRLFTKATHYVQKKELEFCNNPHPLDHRYDTYFTEDVEFETVDGDAEILPGIRVELSPGHTPGIQTVIIQTEQGPVILPGFCCNEKNFPGNGKVVCPGVHYDAFVAYDTAQRIGAMEGTILPMHGLTTARMTFGPQD
ncbi:glyoxylase-like metal-dependent hydrolase (beta-lactamase superfamily II) [Desulfobaculum xiamenense]|uniref:Glyoxylase-like metal-dependent hydrolase (Beta-lactamase superfamily II) n=1 Tax=Desulfobaculum xiamenense TaxID=995050 RepID=A0A846QPE9_9BACT|nr:N-acyl homoserine lactonase family protein [Desulfobaculum xiamenense]NJB68880.1 glyoxylase-like metal-dependent hydrolase (beta-lactamase superfamily II) [Desulfobaculum xiamenense]